MNWKSLLVIISVLIMKNCFSQISNMKYEYAIYEIQTIPTVDTLSVKYYDSSNKVVFEKENYHNNRVNYYKYDSKNRKVELITKDSNTIVKKQNHSYSGKIELIKEYNFSTDYYSEYKREYLDTNFQNDLNNYTYWFCCGDTINPSELLSIFCEYDTLNRIINRWCNFVDGCTLFDYYDSYSLDIEVTKHIIENKVEWINTEKYYKKKSVKEVDYVYVLTGGKTKRMEKYDNQNNLIKSEYFGTLKTGCMNIKDRYEQNAPISNLPDKVIIYSRVYRK